MVGILVPLTPPILGGTAKMEPGRFVVFARYTHTHLPTHHNALSLSLLVHALQALLAPAKMKPGGRNAFFLMALIKEEDAARRSTGRAAGRWWQRSMSGCGWNVIKTNNGGRQERNPVPLAASRRNRAVSSLQQKIAVGGTGRYDSA